MRRKTESRKKFRARGVSLSPDALQAAQDKAHRLDIGFSKYIQRLIKYDREYNILKAA